jgi:hypothetical protein
VILSTILIAVFATWIIRGIRRRFGSPRSGPVSA